jgi:hypothetical protein
MTDRVNNEVGIGGMNALRAFKSYPDHILLVGGDETQYRCEGSFEVINAADMDEHLKACPMLHALWIRAGENQSVMVVADFWGRLPAGGMEVFFGRPRAAEWL